MTWTDQSSLFGFGTVLSSLSVQNLRDNITAQANADAGSPEQADASLQYPVNRVQIDSEFHTTSWGYAEYIGVFNGSYDNYELDVWECYVASADSLVFQVSADSGSTWLAGTNYDYAISGIVGTTSGLAYGRIGAINRNSEFSFNRALFTNPGSTSAGAFKGVITEYLSGNGSFTSRFGYGNTFSIGAAGYNSVRIYANSLGYFNNIASRLYGIR